MTQFDFQMIWYRETFGKSTAINISPETKMKTNHLKNPNQPTLIYSISKYLKYFSCYLLPLLRMLKEKAFRMEIKEARFRKFFLRWKESVLRIGWHLCPCGDMLRAAGSHWLRRVNLSFSGISWVQGKYDLKIKYINIKLNYVKIKVIHI